MISIKLLLKICFRKKKIYLKSKNVTKKLVQLYETKPAFIYSLDLVIQIVKEVFYFEYTITERVWCALFYFIKCKANTVSAKSVQSSSLESKITGFLLYVYIQYIYIHKILPSNFLAASLSTVMTSRRQLEYHIGTAQPPNWRHWQIVCTTSMALLC